MAQSMCAMVQRCLGAQRGRRRGGSFILGQASLVAAAFACLARCNVLIMCRSAQVRERRRGRIGSGGPSKLGRASPPTKQPDFGRGRADADLAASARLQRLASKLSYTRSVLCDCGNIPTTYKISCRDSTRWSRTGRPQHAASRSTVRLHRVGWAGQCRGDACEAARVVVVVLVVVFKASRSREANKGNLV